MNNRSGTIQTLIAIVAGVAVCIWLETSVFNKVGRAANSFSFNRMEKMRSSSGMDDAVMDMTVRATNSQCPRMLDAITRLDSVSKTPDNTFAEYLTITSYDSPKLEDLVELQTRLTQSLLTNVKENEALKTFRDNDISFDFIYGDKNGKPMFHILIGPHDYK